VQRIKSRVAGIAVCLGLAMQTAQGDSFAEATDALCQKQKSCLTAQVSGEEMSPQMQQMMLQMLDGMCQALQQNFVTAATAGHPLQQAATACMRSLSELGCEALENGDVATAECQDYERRAAQYGG